MDTRSQRVAITISGGYASGLNAVVSGAVLAASEFGWEIVGIRNGFEGLLFPERHPEGGVIKLSRALAEHISSAGGTLLGTSVRNDPFHVRTINKENAVEELDRSDDLLKALSTQGITALIAVVDIQSLSLLWKLHRKGLKCVCIPTSIENETAATMLSFGFDSALNFAVETLERAHQAAQASRKLAVVEVLGKHAGWMALQAGMAVCADAVLIPEIPYDLPKVAYKLRNKSVAGRTGGLVVVAEGAKPIVSQQQAESASPASLKASLSPGATEEACSHAIDRSGHAAETVALQLQRLTDKEVYPLVLGQLVKGGTPTAIDRQLGLSYGAGAVRGLHENQSGVMVAFQPPDLKFIPIADTINKVRTVPANSLLVQTVRSLGISLGD